MNPFKDLQILQKENIKVEILLDSPAKLEMLTTRASLSNLITDKNLYRPQLALAGYVGLFDYHQVQVFGNTEIYYLKSLNKKDRVKSFNTIAQFPIPCIVLTNSNKLSPELLAIAEDSNIPVLSTKYETTKAFFLLSEFLDDHFSPQVVIHGSFVDVYGVGLMFIGKAGIGKSEIALDLVERGHRLVTDDVVMLTKKRESVLLGTGTSLVQHFMEIRGLGIIDIRQMFGIRSIRFQKRLEIVVYLEEWNTAKDYARTGLDESEVEIMGVEIPIVNLPIFPGKNITVIAEVIAINYLLRTYGYNAAKVFSDKLTDQISKKTGLKYSIHDQRIISHFQGDIE